MKITIHTEFADGTSEQRTRMLATAIKGHRLTQYLQQTAQWHADSYDLRRPVQVDVVHDGIRYTAKPSHPNT